MYTISWGAQIQDEMHLEGYGDLVNRSKMGITGVSIWLIGVINLLTESHHPPSSSVILSEAKLFHRGPKASTLTSLQSTRSPTSKAKS